MSSVFFQNIGASNTFIGQATSFLSAPWTAKFLWSPLVDVYGTKRKWILVAQAVLGVIALALAGSVLIPEGMIAIVAIFFIMAIASATHDVAIDGYYQDVLNKEQQAFFVGVRNAFYKVAMLVGSGGLVFLAGKLAETTSLGVRGGWCVSFAVCALMLVGCSAIHAFVLPEPERTQSQKDAVATKMTLKEFGKVFLDWLRQPRIAVVFLYILIFRAGDAFMLRMAQPFLLSKTEKGGLEISTPDVGIIYGTVGMLFLLAGGIIGGALVSRFGLKRCLLPTALIQNSAIPLYWWLASARPSGPVNILGFSLTDAVKQITSSPEVLRWFDCRLFDTILVNSAEQFSYGLGTAAYTVFLLSTVKSEYKAAHYAIATGIMALGLMVPGYYSGMIVDAIGYEKFFLFSFLASLPGIVLILFLPLDKSTAKQA